MAKYTTRLPMKKSKSRFGKRPKRNYSSKALKSGGSRKTSRRSRLKMSKKSKTRVRKAVYTMLSVFFIATVIAIIGGLWYMQRISKDLPSPDAPFGSKDVASVIYDRNGEQLYKVYGNENRDPLELPSEDANINEIVPDHVVWAFLAAEDANFYQHPGFDVSAIISCGIKNVAGTSGCGGSTITQQLVKQTVLTSERRMERKIKELILSLQIERLYTKDQILAMYLTVAPMGSNVYGVNTGARFYFGKDLKDLTIAEAAILASLPQNPSILSPTLSTDPERSGPMLKARQEYVLNQMLKYKDKINEEVGDDQFITQEKIEAAKAEEIAYKEPRIDIKAPHFVFYVQKLLQERNYNAGEPFTLAELETGGYRITTTLDYSLQKTAEDFVKNEATGVYGARYGAKNAAVLTMRPGTGEVLSYVGSKDYNAEKEGKLFDPKVDILTSLQQPGSSAKPITYYNAFTEGVAAPGTQLLDIPIQIGNYKPKNSDGRFVGMASARTHLVNSRNIPAIILLESLGVTKYLDTANALGYTTFGDASLYGPSITLGAADVKPIEHAQAFGVFANGGDYVQHEVIMKIEDKQGNVIYEHKPEKKAVADPQALYLVNDVLQGVPASNPNKFNSDGRQVSAKTGTSEDQRDTWYVMYSPDFVTVGWLGNNDNTAMRTGAFGSTSVKPWVQDYMSSILAYFPEKTAFNRPAGISKQAICSGKGAEKVCTDGVDLVIEGKVPPTYITKQSFRVCDDQQNRIARDIDEVTGHAVDKEFVTYLMPAEDLQKYADAYLEKKGMVFPSGECSVDRSPNQGKPWATINSPVSGATYSGNLDINFNAFTANGIVTKAVLYIDGTQVSEVKELPYSGSIALETFGEGSHTFRVVVYDSTGQTGENSVKFNISKGGYTIDAPTGDGPFTSPIQVSASYLGDGDPDSPKLCVDGKCNMTMNKEGAVYRVTWKPSPGTYNIHIQDNNGATSLTKKVVVL